MVTEGGISGERVRSWAKTTEYGEKKDSDFVLSTQNHGGCRGFGGLVKFRPIFFWEGECSTQCVETSHANT